MLKIERPTVGRKEEETAQYIWTPCVALSSKSRRKRREGVHRPVQRGVPCSSRCCLGFPFLSMLSRDSRAFAIILSDGVEC